MVLDALRAGEDGVVVGHHRAADVGVAEQVAVDAADAGDHAVGRALVDQLLHRAPAPLRGDHQRAVLDEGAGIAEVLARSPGRCAAAWPAAGPPPRAGRRRGSVARRSSTSSQVGPDGVEVDLLLDHLLAGDGVARLDPHEQGWPSKMVSPAATPMPRTVPPRSARTSCSIFMDSITASSCPGRTSVALGHGDGDDGALQRRGDPDRAVRPGRRPGDDAARVGGRRHRRRGRTGPGGLAVGQHRERVVRVDAGTAPAGRVAVAVPVAVASAGGAPGTLDEAAHERGGGPADQVVEVVVDEAGAQAAGHEVRMRPRRSGGRPGSCRRPRCGTRTGPGACRRATAARSPGCGARRAWPAASRTPAIVR